MFAGDRVGVAVSGGIDSVALLRLLLELRGELGIVPSLIHFNHRLRGAESDADQEFVIGLAHDFGLEFYSSSDDTAARAAEKHSGVEAVARELRYGFFRGLLRADGSVDCADGCGAASKSQHQELKPHFLSAPDSKIGVGPFPIALPSTASPQFHPDLDKICTGHTLDDQAETVLMRMIRGTGLKGLGAIQPRLPVEGEGDEVVGEIVRPVLGVRRVELERYLRELGQAWREDASNSDDHFTRNRIRHKLMPLLEREFNPSIAENLAELAEIARGEEDYWENEAAGWMGTTVQWSEPEWLETKSTSQPGGLVDIQSASNPESKPAPDDLQSRVDSVPWLVVNGSIDRRWLLGEPLAVQRRVIKAVGDYVGLALEFRHIEEILRLAAAGEETSKELPLPLGWKVVLHEADIVFVTPDLRHRAEPEVTDYEYELPVPGRLLVAEIGTWFETQRTFQSNSGPAADLECLLDPASLPGALLVRNWRAGDRYWPSHTKAAKKIKELLQQKKATLPERKLWPVIQSGNEIVWVRGFPLAETFRAKPGAEAILITVGKFGAG
ncbi:MAG TPA: tRNA lysidine(34) synthetase TilS [Candidatus Sulfotelmatobacter sp.]